MNGLLASNFYAMESSMKLSLLIAIPISIIPLLIGDATLLPMIIAIQTFIFASNTGVSLKMDESSKWNRFEMTLPVTRTSIITAKYLSFLGLILMGVLVTLITVALQSIKGEIASDLLFFGYSFGLQLAFMTIAIVYPLILKIGAEKSDTLLFVAAGVAVAVRFGMWYLLYLGDETINIRSSLVSGVSLVLAVAMFALSYVISVIIYRKKEFS